LRLKEKISNYNIKSRWNGHGGYREVTNLAAPLIVSTGAVGIQEFVDRMFLSWYSTDAIAAALPSGILIFVILALFLGTAMYVSTFVAQYFGAGRHDRIGPSTWQGIYIAVIGGGVCIALVPLAPALFKAIGHSAEVQALEVVYFRIMCYGAFFPIASSALSGFFAGLGRTGPVMWVNIAATGVNVILNYLMIFGKMGLPRMGIAGAALATVISTAVGFFLFLILILRAPNRNNYNTGKGLLLDKDLFARLLRFGLPNGVHFQIEILGFTTFVLLVGRLGTVELAATNIAININSLAFMPMLGLGMAVSVLVGQYLGENRVDLAQRSVYSGLLLSILYMGVLVILYVFIPNVFAGAFSTKSDPVTSKQIQQVAVILLRFVAIYCIFDGINIIFSSAIKGAGDTRYVMVMTLVLSTSLLIFPSFLTIVVLHRGIYLAWAFVTLYIVTLGFGFLFRFLSGKWKSMRVIEEAG
jgi:MATE family multidrug resistance protein